MAALREEMLAQNYMNSNRYAMVTVTPEQRWKDWLRVNERVVAEAAAVPAESLLVDVKDPTDAELQEFYDKYKDREASPEIAYGTTELPSATPGFRIPRKIDLAFIEANYDSYHTKAEEKVTDEEIAKYYEDHKDPMFIKADTGLMEDKGETKDDAATAPPAEGKAAEQPATPPATDATPPAAEEKDAEKEKKQSSLDDARRRAHSAKSLSCRTRSRAKLARPTRRTPIRPSPPHPHACLPPAIQLRHRRQPPELPARRKRRACRAGHSSEAERIRLARSGEGPDPPRAGVGESR